MFKELGEFIDNVGRNVGFFAKKILSKNEPHEMTGIIDEPFDEIDDKRLEELFKEGKISKEAYDMLIDIKKNNK